ncbi:TetR/AcrR family transcriptional regulator [Paraburkholderia tropica]|uniref:TetR/AcrR family transcriptional regulator n=1 Tax=Paraburkholderia tropica TaxID=92647 RepID=UPI00161C4339|nr:TetR/AcrR family transcriptional regulator [Paraburkholderia tropica]MBB2983400.1 AcrR family transcriptional regulator [Paraburkholderia tropica]
MDSDTKASSDRPRLATRKRDLVRTTILDAAESLLSRKDVHDFSMKELAAEAGMALTTAFAHFGSKGGVMRAIADRLIKQIADEYSTRPRLDDAIDRLLAMANIGVDLITSRAAQNRVVCSHVLVSTEDHSGAGLRVPTAQLWKLAIDDSNLFGGNGTAEFQQTFTFQLAVMFRGALAIWIGEELSDEQFRTLVTNGIIFSTLGFVAKTRREALVQRIVPFNLPSAALLRA